MRPSLLIAEPDGFTPSVLITLREWANVSLGPIAYRDIRTQLTKHDIVWIRLGHRIESRDIPTKIRCRIIAVPTTGLDHIDIKAVSAAGIILASLRGEVEFLRSVTATAEHTIGLILSLLRHIPSAHSAVLRGEWDRDRFRGRELAGRRVGILGAGRLGCMVATYLQAFGCKILAYDPRPDFPSEMPRARDLKTLLEFSEILTIHASYSASTHHLLGMAELSCLPRGAYVINTSRGGIIDDRALATLLQNDQLGGAAIDVIEGEPIVGRDHSLVRLALRRKSIIITPHLGGNTTDSFAKTEEFLAETIYKLWKSNI